MNYILLFFVVISCIVFTSDAAIQCIANGDLLYDFENIHWRGRKFDIQSDQYNFPPYMIGTYHYTMDFCYTVGLDNNGMGWNMGELTQFQALDDVPGNDIPIVQFVQYYTDGDIGPPCIEPRSTQVNIFCGTTANCSTIPGNRGPACLDPLDSPNSTFCVCGIVYNNISICSGLTFYLLSNNCTKGIPKPILPHIPVVNDTTGIIIGTLIALIFIGCFGGCIYNYSVQGKRGAMMIPFYDTCTGSKHTTTYSPGPSTYGAVGI